MSGLLSLRCRAVVYLVNFSGNCYQFLVLVGRLHNLHAHRLVAPELGVVCEEPEQRKLKHREHTVGGGGGGLTGFPVHPVKHIVLGNVVHILGIKDWVDLERLQWHDHTRVVQEVPDGEITPPNWEIVREARRGCARTEQAVDRPP